MNEKELEQLQNDLMIATTLLSASLSDDELDEFTDEVEERYLDNVKKDIINNALFLNEYALKMEVYEACSIYKSVLKRIQNGK